MFGDSNTWTKNAEIQAIAAPYAFTLMQNDLRQDNWYFINHGDGADTAANLVTKYTIAVNDRYVLGARNILVVAIGINDANASRPDTDFDADLQTIVGAAQTLGYEVFVCTIPPRNDGVGTGVNSFVDSYNVKINADGGALGYTILDVAILFDSNSDHTYDTGGKCSF